MTCSICAGRVDRPPIVCDKCGRLVCDRCRTWRYVSLPGFKLPKGPTKKIFICKLCLAEEALTE